MNEFIHDEDIKKIRDDFVSTFSQYGMELIETDKVCVFVTNRNKKYRHIGKSSYLCLMSNRWDVPFLRREPADKVKNNMRIGRGVRNWGEYDLVFIDEPLLLSELIDPSFPIVRKCVIGFISADDRKKKKKTKGVKRMPSSEQFITMCKSNVPRRLAVINSRTDKVEFELIGAFSLEVDDDENQIEVVAETEDGEYKKHIIGLNENTMYVIEDLGGAKVNKYKYEINYIPESIVPFDVVEKD